MNNSQKTKSQLKTNQSADEKMTMSKHATGHFMGGVPKTATGNQMNYKLREAIETVLLEAKTKIEALGAYCLIEPISLHQGMTISLHAGEAVNDVAATYTALEVGEEMAYSKEGREQFSQRLAFAIETIEMAHSKEGREQFSERMSFAIGRVFTPAT